MNRISSVLAFLLGFLLACPAVAQPVRVGPLDVRNALAEIAAGGSGAQAAARVNLGLGNLATQAASGVAITGGTMSGVTISLGAAGGANVIATGGTTARSLAAWTADWSNVKSFGAVGDGITPDLTALSNTPSPSMLPTGTFALAGSMATLPGNHRWSSNGSGAVFQSVESGVTRRQSGHYARISAAPTDASNPAYIFTAYDGDFSNVQFDFQTYITGAATLTQPLTGFHYARVASGISGTLLNTSGWNQSTSVNDGRTAVEMIDLTYTHSGNGGTGGMSVSGYVNGARAGATSFLANPAGTVLVGGVTAGANGVYLQALGDLGLVDNGYDVAAAGLVLNFNRTNGTGALGATWMGERLQSIGTVAIDAFYTAKGPARIGMDLSTITLQTPAGVPTKSAIALAAGQAIYGNATNTDGTKYPVYTSPGTEWFDYETATGWNLVVGGVPILQAAGTGITATQLRISSPSVPATSTTACSQGQLSYDAGYLYVCVATNTWKRTALSSW